MDLGGYLQDQDSVVMQAALDICSLLLRQVSQIDYSDFTSDPKLQTKLQRLEQTHLSGKVAKAEQTAVHLSIEF